MTLPEEFTWSTQDGVAVVHTPDELDLHNADRLREWCQRAIEESGPRIVVDLSGTSFMDSSALGVFVRLAKQSKAGRGWLRLVTGNRSAVQKILKLTALDSTLGNYFNVEEAIGA